MSLVVDANVVIKWYADEASSLDAERLLQRDDILIAPGHLFGEVGEVLVRLLDNGELAREQLDLARAALPGSVLLVSLDHLFSDAVEIANSTRQSVYDCLYVAAAMRWDTVVVTDDRKLIKTLAETPWEKFVVLLHDWARGQSR